MRSNQLSYWPGGALRHRRLSLGERPPLVNDVPGLETKRCGRAVARRRSGRGAPNYGFMRRYAFALAAAFSVVAALPLASVAADTPADTICPRVVPKMIALNDAGLTNDATKVLPAVQAVVTAYKECQADHLANKPIEPSVNYDRTRQAQFLIVVGRTYNALGQTDDAIRAYRESRATADDVANWTPSAGQYSRSVAGATSANRNTDRQPSRYRDTAIEIRKAAEDALAALHAANVAPSPAASPAPAASPKV